MVGWLRSLLIYLLVLAVPAQGMAAVTMVLCGTSHHGVAGHAAEQAPCGEGHTTAHHLPANDVAAAAQPHAMADTKADTMADTQVHTCSVCADCCSVGAMPASLMAMPADAPAATVFTTPVLPINFVALDGLERPPRPPWA